MNLLPAIFYSIITCKCVHSFIAIYEHITLFMQ